MAHPDRKFSEAAEDTCVKLSSLVEKQVLCTHCGVLMIVNQCLDGSGSLEQVLCVHCGVLMIANQCLDGSGSLEQVLCVHCSVWMVAAF